MKIKFLIPYKELQGRVLNIINKSHFPYEVEIQSIVVAVEDLSKLNVTEADAVIGRGYTAKRLRKEYPQLIIVELPITSYDVFRALKKIRSLYSPTKVGFCGGYSQMKGSKALEEWLGCPLQIYFDEDPAHIVFCQAKIPTFIMKIPHRHQGNFPTFSEDIRMRFSQPHPAA